MDKEEFDKALNGFLNCSGLSNQQLHSDSYYDQTDFSLYIDELLNEIESQEIRERIFNNIMRKIDTHK